MKSASNWSRTLEVALVRPRIVAKPWPRPDTGAGGSGGRNAGLALEGLARGPEYDPVSGSYRWRLKLGSGR